MPVPATHFVNGHRLEAPFPAEMEQAVFGMGCFWGAERKFWELEGVYSTAVGYAAGYTPNPTYREVCTGMTVTAYFGSGGTVTATESGAWADLLDGTFGVRTGLFSLSMAATGSPGNDALWSLRNLGGFSLLRLVLSGAPGRTVFDVLDSDEFTPGSAFGMPVIFVPADWDDPVVPAGTVTYRNAVGVGGSAPLGDLFEQLDLAFHDGLAAGASVDFAADADMIGAGAVLEPGGNGAVVTPEPSTVLLVAGGLAGLLARAARRRVDA